MKSLSPYDRMALMHGSTFAKKAMQSDSMQDAEVFWMIGREMAKEAGIGQLAKGGIKWLKGKAGKAVEGVKDWWGREKVLFGKGPEARKAYKELWEEKKFVDEAAAASGGRRLGKPAVKDKAGKVIREAEKTPFEQQMERFQEARGIEGTRAPQSFGQGAPDVGTGLYRAPTKTDAAQEAVEIAKRRKAIDKGIVQGEKAGLTPEQSRKALEAPVVTRTGHHGEEINELEGLGRDRAGYEAQRYLRDRYGDVGKPVKGLTEKAEDYVTRAEKGIGGFFERHPVTATAGTVLLADKMVG